MTIRPYDEVSKDPKASPLERETALLCEWNKTLHKNAALRGRTARLCRAVSARMQADEPTPEDRIELMQAYDAACALLLLPNDQVELPPNGGSESKKGVVGG